MSLMQRWRTGFVSNSGFRDSLIHEVEAHAENYYFGKTALSLQEYLGMTDQEFFSYQCSKNVLLRKLGIIE